MTALLLVLVSFAREWDTLAQRVQFFVNQRELYAAQERFPNWGDCYLRISTAREHINDMPLLYWKYPGDYRQDYYAYLESVDRWVGIYMLVLEVQDSSTDLEKKCRCLSRLKAELGEEIYLSGKLPLPYSPALVSKTLEAREYIKRYYKPRRLPGFGSKL